MKITSQVIIQNITFLNPLKMREKSTIKNRLAFSLAGLYSTAWTLSFAALFWGFNSKIFSETALAQSVVPSSERLLPPPPLRVPPLPPANFNREINPAFRNRPYRLGPGDQITVQVQRFPELGFTGAISPEGVIVMPLIGTVNVRGLTVEESQQRLRERFTQFIKNPQVSAALLVQRPVVVTVTGEVARPGFYPLQTPQLPTALAAAAGTTPTAELRAVRVRRTLPGGAVAEQIVDILTPLQTGIAPPDLRLEDGDAIVVPYKQVTPDRKSDQDLASRYSLAAAAVPVQVTVTGEVSKPGFYTLPAGSGRISAALVAAGGVTGKADLREVRVRRTLMDGSSLEEPIDLYTPLANANDLFDFPLASGDVIVIPELDASTKNLDYDKALVARSTLIKPRIYVRVLSYASGGLTSFYVENGSRFLDAVNNLPVNLANLRKIALIRFDEKQGRAINRSIDAKAALEGNISQNPLLEDNDVIVIGRNLVERIGYVINTFTRPFRDTLGFILFFEQLRNGVTDLFGPSRNDR
ncbi:polysaccharide export protein [Microcoleus vaginatus GB1-A2]|uniref:polysaccharide biosynthesis/export family protein n=1 Tax=Microcoleus vaginatus TaxID=119532 RepID=UPI0016879853|nr:polysaccharide export protein [Microcoleus sp. FACHB-61]